MARIKLPSWLLKTLGAIASLIPIYVALAILENIGTGLLFTFGSGVYTVVTVTVSGLPWLILTGIFFWKSSRKPLLQYEKRLGREIEIYRWVGIMTVSAGLMVSGLILGANFLKPLGDYLPIAAISIFAACLLYNLVGSFFPNQREQTRSKSSV